MIHAEISIYPMATPKTSASFHIAKAIESIQDMEGIRYQINPMGTVLESDNIDKIYEAVKSMSEVVHNLGVERNFFHLVEDGHDLAKAGSLSTAGVAGRRGTGAYQRPVRRTGVGERLPLTFNCL